MEPCVRRAWSFPDEPASPEPVPSRGPGPLWMAVHLPWLAGEVLARGTERPLAVSAESRRGWVVYRASPGAHRRGVCPGMTVSAASVVCPDLAARRRSPRREERRLQAIGDRMLSFSPVVSIQPPETVLLEVRGSLNLFGGAARLRTLIGRELDAAGHVHHIAGAPTPLAAGYLARWGRDVVVAERTALRSALGAMPVALLSLDPATVRRLEQAGLRILRDLWRLPADGLGRRFGAALVRELDRLRGGHPDPRPLHASAPYFSARLMLDWATDDLVQINRGVEYLLVQWVDYLRRSARATSGFSIECLPECGGDRMRVDIGVRHISRDMDHLRRLAAERLSRVRLPGPVVELVLSSDRIHAVAGRSGQLFETKEDTVMQWRRTEELLAARLGGQGLETLHTAAEHRPEHAWGRAPGPPPGGRSRDRGRRPLWLLDTPRPLPWAGVSSAARPKIVTGPERIEAGWWDRHDQRRDYYIATDLRGRRLWVFRDLRREQWYLHGLFA